MMTSKMKTILATATATATLLLSACSSNQGGFQTGTGNSATPTVPGDNNSQDDGTLPTPPPAKPAVDLDGYVDGGQYSQKQTFTFDKAKNEFVISLPLGMDGTLPLINGTIQSLPDISFYVNRGGDGTTYLVLRVPIRYFVRGVSAVPAGRLPNGDPLPMPSGELPAVAFEIKPGSKQKAYLYIGVEAIGVFVESSFISCQGLPICIDMQFPIRNSTRTKVLGYFSLLMPKSGAAGGFFISSVLPPEVARILDEHFIP